MLPDYVYYAGISSCGIQGAEKAASYTPFTQNILICAFLTGFGGGLIRDLILLHRYPVAFTLECLPDITVALVSAMIYTYWNKNHLSLKSIKWFSIFADAAGLARYIAIGVNAAQSLESNNIMAILCGISTALGGGILSSLFCGIPLKTILKASPFYRLITILNTVMYIHWLNNGFNSLAAQSALILYTFIGVLACNREVRNSIKRGYTTIRYSELSLILVWAQKEDIVPPYILIIIYRIPNPSAKLYRTQFFIYRGNVLAQHILQM